MVTINISIDVHNAHEIVKSRKGFFAGLLAKFFLSEKKLKQEVEKRMGEKLIEELRNHLNEGLTKEGVEAKVRYTYYLNDDDSTFV